MTDIKSCWQKIVKEMKQNNSNDEKKNATNGDKIKKKTKRE